MAGLRPLPNSVVEPVDHTRREEDEDDDDNNDDDMVGESNQEELELCVSEREQQDKSFLV